LTVSASVTKTTVRAEVHLSTAQLAAAVDISRTRLARLVALGLVDPPEPDTGEFPSATAARLRRMLRLRRELHVNLVGATIILDLLERLERLETELARARRGTNE
jgi:MerR family transcriptional regulator, heat shock protein HspR